MGAQSMKTSLITSYLLEELEEFPDDSTLDLSAKPMWHTFAERAGFKCSGTEQESEEAIRDVSAKIKNGSLVLECIITPNNGANKSFGINPQLCATYYVHVWLFNTPEQIGEVLFKENETSTYVYLAELQDRLLAYAARCVQNKRMQSDPHAASISITNEFEVQAEGLGLHYLSYS